MKFNKANKIHAAASNDASHYSVRDVMFEKDEDHGRLIATNGRILVVVPVKDCAGDVEGMVPVDAIKAATKGRAGEATMLAPDEDRLRVLTKEGIIDMVRAPEDVRFPDYRSVLPAASREEIKITLSGKELRNLLDAMGVLSDDMQGITLGIAAEDGASSPVSVCALDPENKAYGVIMPISG